mmetsp:Transcript_12645/g.36325  ORF Transcript_12645/g.36325 Transcript_12645/m.36325 type:complete len:219 (-) Transcript_12645:95-751(-)
MLPPTTARASPAALADLAREQVGAAAGARGAEAATKRTARQDVVAASKRAAEGAGAGAGAAATARFERAARAGARCSAIVTGGRLGAATLVRRAAGTSEGRSVLGEGATVVAGPRTAGIGFCLPHGAWLQQGCQREQGLVQLHVPAAHGRARRRCGNGPPFAGVWRDAPATGRRRANREAGRQAGRRRRLPQRGDLHAAGEEETPGRVEALASAGPAT